jgi:arylsulfatase A-like enzyme
MQESRVVDTPISLVDILPTIGEVTGAILPSDRKIDGTSLLPLINNQPWKRIEPILWFFYRTRPEVALLQDRYMLMGIAQDTIPRTHAFTSDDMDFVKNIQLTDFELYNLENDDAQIHDIGTNKPEILRLLKTKMVQKLEDIKKEAPVWGNLPKTGASNTQEKTAWSP